MTTPLVGAPVDAPAGPRGPVSRLKAAIAATAAVVLGVAPHVLHHAGPLAGAALLAGVTGTLLFGLLGLLLSIPMLRRIHDRTGGWRVPAGLLALMAVVWALSAFVIGPALTGSDGSQSSDRPGAPTPHEAHHQ